MSSQTVEQLSFDFLPHRSLVVQQHEGQLSSDAGLLPLRQFDQCWCYTQRMALCMIDDRQDPRHDLLSMLRQRLYGILAGYQDCNDHDSQDLPQELRAGQPCTWITRLIKVAALVVQSARRILVRLAGNWPWWSEYQAVTRRSLSFSCGP